MSCPMCKTDHAPTTPHVVGEGRAYLAREGILSARSCLGCRRSVWGLWFVSAACLRCSSATATSSDQRALRFARPASRGAPAAGRLLPDTGH